MRMILAKPKYWTNKAQKKTKGVTPKMLKKGNASDNNIPITR